MGAALPSEWRSSSQSCDDRAPDTFCLSRRPAAERGFRSVGVGREHGRLEQVSRGIRITPILAITAACASARCASLSSPHGGWRHRTRRVASPLRPATARRLGFVASRGFVLCVCRGSGRHRRRRRHPRRRSRRGRGARQSVGRVVHAVSAAAPRLSVRWRCQWTSLVVSSRALPPSPVAFLPHCSTRRGSLLAPGVTPD